MLVVKPLHIFFILFLCFTHGRSLSNKYDYISSKIIIAGTGRSGTTFLVLLYTLLGFRTGWTAENVTQGVVHCRGGLELTDLGSKEAVDKVLDIDVIKSPFFTAQLDLLQNLLPVKYVVIPVRNFTESAISRSKCGLGQNGGFFGPNVTSVEGQVQHYEALHRKLQEDVVQYRIPVIFVDFGGLISNATYLFHVLLPTLTGWNTLNPAIQTGNSAPGVGVGVDDAFGSGWGQGQGQVQGPGDGDGEGVAVGLDVSVVDLERFRRVYEEASAIYRTIK